MSVWSDEKFASGEINRWPFEFDRILAYRGTSREIFFPREHSPDLSQRYDEVSEEYRLPSVLKTRYLIPENNLGTQHGNTAFENWKYWYKEKLMKEEDLSEEEAERAWEEFLESGKENRLPEHDELLDTKEPGVFFAPRSVVEARKYYDPNVPESIMLKVLIPTDSVVVNYRRDGDNIRSKNTRMMERQFSGLEEFREICRRSVKYGNEERLQYITADASLEWIEGVLDTGCSEDFVELGEYVRWLSKRCFWEMEKFSFDIKAHESIKKELEFLKELYNYIQKLEYYLRLLNSKKEELERLRQNTDRKELEYRENRYSYLQRYKSYLVAIEEVITGRDIKGPGYDEVLRETRELVDDEFSYFSEIAGSAVNKGVNLDLEDFGTQIRSLDELYSIIPSTLETLEEVKQEVEKLEKRFEEEYSEEYGSAEEFREEIGFEAKLDRRIFMELKQLPPRLRVIKENLDTELEKVERDISGVEEGDYVSPDYQSKIAPSV